MALPKRRQLPFNFSFFGEIFQELWVNSSSLTFCKHQRRLELMSKHLAPPRRVAAFAALTCNGCRSLEIELACETWTSTVVQDL